MSIIDAKAECAGRQRAKVNPRHTIQMCHTCGNIGPTARKGKHYQCTSPPVRLGRRRRH
ncbi:zinc ribbon domain-containing protein [Sinomonas halotolerans]|uniref:zinc ribbon domain-containing protein n=1 Tax=Sinomonas halotolerans TaxID=1644133 RepID=UPI003D03977C